MYEQGKGVRQLYAILGLLTGIATIIYQIFAGKILAYTIILGS